MDPTCPLRKDGGLVPYLAQGFEDVVERAARRIEAKLRCPDANVVDLESFERA
jgi:hypothetical protein